MKNSTRDSFQKVKFSPVEGENFLLTVRKRVDEYLKNNGLQPNATWPLHFKVLLHFAVAVLLYAAILSQYFPIWLMFLMSMALGITSGFIGVNLCHDCLHGSYFSSPKMNRLFGYFYDMVGLSSFIWKATHNGGHHTYTNIAGLDPDIDKPGLLRLAPSQPYLKAHKWQHIYIWALYSLVGLNWIYYADYAGLAKEWKKISNSELFLFGFFKIINFLLLIAIPMLVIDLPWWQILIGYLGYQLAGGFAVALIFQLAHVVENLDFPTPDEQGIIGRNWGEHEIYTTANFATKSKCITYLCGGLNFQIEHHLMPYISHVHYKNISPIVKAAAEEFGLPYCENETMCAAIVSHWRLLKKLGTSKDIYEQRKEFC